MKKIITVLSIITFLLACENVSCGCVQPEFSIFDGKWKLIKISYGFPAPNMPTSTTDVPNEVYEFNSLNQTYSISTDKKVIESGKYEVSSTDKGNYVEKKIVFIEKKMYSNYTFSNNNQELILYQRSPEGAILADGNSFHYQKAK